MKITFQLWMMICFCLSLKAQSPFISKGKIEFERKINVHKLVVSTAEDQEDNEWLKEYLNKTPKFALSYFDLFFEDQKTIFQPGKEVDAKVEEWFIGPAKKNRVMVDLAAQRAISQKLVFESNYQIEDSVRHMQWKIENETRTIAGFECRKAVGIICDSVYVVAFYTDEIAVSGGPESFNGLPGMILGIAIPRLYTTWFATKVEMNTAPVSGYVLKPKGKKTTHTLLEKELKESSMKNWGKEGQKNIWWCML